MADKKKKSIDDRMEQFEKDLKRLDRLIEEQGAKFRKDVQGFEKKFKKAVDEGDVEIGEIVDKAGKEMDRLKKELEFTSKALRNSFNYFRAQYKNREK